MDARTASIAFYGKTLQYAEVERKAGASPTLLRLGHCEFDFDLEKTLSKAGDTEHLHSLTDALREIFAQSAATNLNIAVHPSVCTAFFTPLPEDTSREARRNLIQKQVQRLNSFDAAYPPMILSEFIRTEDLGETQVDWFHVVRIDHEMAARFEQLTMQLPVKQYRFFTTTRCVARILDAFRNMPSETYVQNPYILAVGWYPGHIEYTLCNAHGWFFSCFNRINLPSDSAYFVASLLKRLNIPPRKIGRLLLYGHEPTPSHFAPFQGIFQSPPEPLNPFMSFAQAKNLGQNVAATAYAPCVGAGLLDF